MILYILQKKKKTFLTSNYIPSSVSFNSYTKESFFLIRFAY